MWCWAGAPLLPALPWLGSLLSGCIGLAKASHSASGGSSQALWSETCRRRGQRVSGCSSHGHSPRAAPAGNQPATLQAKDPAPQSVARRQAANSHPCHAWSLPVLRGTGMDTRALAAEAVMRTGCSMPACPLVSIRILRDVLQIPELRQLCDLEQKSGARWFQGPLLQLSLFCSAKHKGDNRAKRKWCKPIKKKLVWDRGRLRRLRLLRRSRRRAARQGQGQEVLALQLSSIPVSPRGLRDCCSSCSKALSEVASTAASSPAG